MTAALLLPATLAAQRATLERITHQDSLANGLHVVVLENHTVPLVTVEVVVRAGAMTQTPDDQGVPHLFEHMLFKEYRGPREETFGQQIGELHGSYNGTTSEEEVTYYVIAPSEKTGDAMDALARLVRDPDFDDDALRTERFVVLGELQRRSSEPVFLLDQAIGMRLWGGAWPRKNVIGNILALMAVNPKQLEGIFRQWYVPNNAALIVTGDVDAARALAMARKRFGGWKRRADPFLASPVPPMPALDSSTSIVLTGDVKDVTIELVWQGPRATAERSDTYAADALSSMIEDPDGRFQTTLVDAGLFHSASLSYQTLNHTGPIIFTGTASFEKLPAALTALSTQIMMMRDPEYYDSTHLEIARKRRIVGTALELEQGSQLASTIGYWWAVTGLDYFLGYTDSLSTRGATDLAGFVNRYMLSRPFVIGAVTTPANGEAVSRMLQQYIDLATNP